MLNFFSTNRFRLKFLLVLTCVVVSVSCQNDETAMQDDVTATVTTNKTSQMLKSGQKLKAEDMDAIKTVFEKYPESESVMQIYKSALISRGDWASLAKLLKTIPLNNLSDEDKANLGKTYMKLGRFKDTIEVLKPYASSDNLENKSLLASAYFRLGDYENAKPLLDNNWDEIIKEKRVSDMTTRGMIYFYEKDNDKAIEVLDKTLEIEPGNIPAANVLSRVYSTKGETVKAEEYLAKVQQGFDKMTAEETRKTNLVSKLYKLQEAYKAKRFQTVIDLAEEIIPQADAKNKAALMQYLFNSYNALGKTKEAQEVMARAKQMQQK